MQNANNTGGWNFVFFLETFCKTFASRTLWKNMRRSKSRVDWPPQNWFCPFLVAKRHFSVMLSPLILDSCFSSWTIRINVLKAQHSKLKFETENIRLFLFIRKMVISKLKSEKLVRVGSIKFLKSLDFQLYKEYFSQVLWNICCFEYFRFAA